MAEEIEFVNGLIVKAPRDGAPDFVKASISIKSTDLMVWLSKREGDWVNIDVKESKGGKWYAAVSTFKPKEGTRSAAATKPQPDKAPAPSGFNDFEDDIPF